MSEQVSLTKIIEATLVSYCSIILPTISLVPFFLTFRVDFAAKKKTVKKGDRIAQLVLEKISTPEVIEVEDLDSTERGAGGFGSTGIASEAKHSRIE